MAARSRRRTRPGAGRCSRYGFRSRKSEVRSEKGNVKGNRLILLPLAAAAAVFLMPPLRAQQSVPAGYCRIDGKAVSGAIPIPGVAVVIKSGETAAGATAATSTETDGT